MLLSTSVIFNNFKLRQKLYKLFYNLYKATTKVLLVKYNGKKQK